MSHSETKAPVLSNMEAKLLIERYFEAWNTADNSMSRDLWENVWAKEGAFIDARSTYIGLESVYEHLLEYQKQIPDHKFVVTSEIDNYKNILRYTWSLLTPENTVRMEGMDVIDLTAQGKIQRALGFSTPNPTPL